MSDIFARIKQILRALIDRCATLRRSTLAWTGLALAAVVLLSINLVSSIGLKTWRADLTQDGLYTISDGTREILKDIDEPINAKLYFSRNLAAASPDVARYFERVRALFQQYRDISGGKLHLTVLDPEPFTDAEDKAVASGLKGLTLNAAGDVGYFGLVATNATDNQQVIPFFSPSRESFLEYDVTKLIYALEHPKKRTIGLMTSLPLDGGKPSMRNQQPDPWLILTQIREFFDVRPIDQNVKEIPSDIDALMIAQPTKLTPEAAFAIDQYALKGGKVLAFVDPSSETAYMQLLKEHGDGEKVFTKLLHGWGVNFDRKKVATDIRHARRVQFGGANGQGTVTDFVAWLGLDKTDINPKDVLAAGIEQINLASAGFLSKVDDASIKFSPILETSSDADVVDVSQVGFGADPLALLRNYVSGGKKLVLAARLSGEVKSAFPDGPPKPPSDDKAAASKDDKAADKTKTAADSSKTATESSKPTSDAAKTDSASKTDSAKSAADAAKATSAPKAASTATDSKASDKPNYVKSGQIHAIVVADTDILADRFWVTSQNIGGQNVAMPIAHNAAFVIGALENLSGSNALIALRGRGVKERPFTLVQALQRNAERKFRSKEEALEEKLKTAQSELQKLQTSGGGKAILSDKEQDAVDKFRGEMLTTRRELRNVKHALRQNIDELGGWLKFANIAFVPLMLGAAAIGLSWRRTRQRRRKPKNEC